MIPGNSGKYRPKSEFKNYKEAYQYYKNQKMTRVLALYNRARSILYKTFNPKKKENLTESITILGNWIENNKKSKKDNMIGGSKVIDCCDSDKSSTKCRRRSDGKVFRLPRKFSKDECKHPSGFSMRASCAPFLDC